jgi:hypothetical protein
MTNSNSKINTNTADIRSLSEADLSAVSGGQQVYVTSSESAP